ncbi:MAG: hypothetical protein ACKVP0_26770 [Pirellulaceae bacterium]
MSQLLRNLAILGLATLATSIAAAQEGGVSAEHHPWGRFPKGSWKLTRVITEILDPLGNVTATTITETRTTLIDANATTYTLRYEVTTESLGKRFVGAPQTKVLGYSGNAAGEPVTAKKIGNAEVEVNGRKIPCEVRQIQIERMGTKPEVIMVSFNPTVSPYVLRKEGTATAAAEGPKISTTVEVMALAPCKVLADRRNAAFIRTIEKREDLTITTMETTCDDIPGGEVARSSQEQNAENKPLRRTTLELLDFHVGNERPDEAWGGRRRVLHRSRPRRGEEMQPSPRR